MNGQALVRYARDCVKEALGGPRVPAPEGDWTRKHQGTFVTLRWADGRLHGCIGTLEPRMPVVEDVAKNAAFAATQDPRSEPVSLGDVEHFDVELSLLSALEPIAFDDEASALAAIEPGKHGVVFAYRGRRSTFLPAMWSRFTDVETFMGALKQKAGFAADFWAADVELWRYVVEKHVDRAPRGERV